MARSTTTRGTTRRPGTRRTTPKPPANDASVETTGEEAAKPTRKRATAKAPAATGTTRAIKPASAVKPRTPRKPKAETTAAEKPATAPSKAKERGRVGAATDAVRDRLPDLPKVPDLPKLPDLPSAPVVAKRAAIGAGLLGAAGYALFLWRESRADQPDYQSVEQDGAFEVREYPALTTASATERGPRTDAVNRAFETLAGYISGKARGGGSKIAMTAPVLTQGSDTDGWQTSFIMPSGHARADLPKASPGVTLTVHPPRRAATVRFSGRATDALLERKTAELREWLRGRGYPHEAKVQYAFYNSPFMPGPLRRNEIVLTLSEG